MKTNRSYLCTRPRLASMLISAGIPTRKIDNPFSEEGMHQKAWDTELNDKSVQIIVGYYAEAGKPLPASVAAYMKEGAANG